MVYHHVKREILWIIVKQCDKSHQKSILHTQPIGKVTIANPGLCEEHKAKHKGPLEDFSLLCNKLLSTAPLEDAVEAMRQSI